ncbi:hypothetical protein [Alkalihalobacillus trypoxylicola]|uniref:Sodium:proton antiporter n=1 Tax=Alkalihalobacillus trypoxylicola TaxID=519424 RepID=A0A162E970_9BACI|nr:hypothetical protein [Alkalihalobacillus trypoxylicola]KYG32083.1 sodium:proton antiporter [Alkalihalobacillus trypoxylicola]
MRTFIYFMVSFLAFYLSMKYRYKMMNQLLRRRWLRRISVSLAMQIPFIRERFMKIIFSPQSKTDSKEAAHLYN